MALTRRERQSIIAATVLLALVVAFQVLVRPALGRVRTLRRIVAEQRDMLSKVQAKRAEYQALRAQLDKIRQTISQQQQNRQILSHIERLQKDAGLIQKVVYMKPTTTAISDMYEETNVEVKFAGVTLDQIIQFLLKVQSSDPPAGVKTLEIRRGLQNPELLDAVIQLVNLSTIEQD